MGGQVERGKILDYFGQQRSEDFVDENGASHYIFSRVHPDCFHWGGHQILGWMASDWQHKKPQKIRKC
jgi:hypothetical protein